MTVIKWIHDILFLHELKYYVGCSKYTGPLENHPSTFLQCVDYVRSFLIMLTFPGPLAEIIKSATAVFSRPLSDVSL
jgi:hypothetical protein